MSDLYSQKQIFDRLNQLIDITWIAGKQNADRRFRRALSWSDRSTLIGHLNLMHRNRIQVLSKYECHYLRRLSDIERLEVLDNIFNWRTGAVVICDDIEVSNEFISRANEHGIPLLVSSLNSNDLITSVRYYLSNMLADKTTLHGVFMEVMGTGVLITGESGIGKSELALELISRGHRLIADDVPEFTRIAPELLLGSCPDMLSDFLEVRGLGVLNIRQMYGDKSLKSNKYLRLIIHLKRMDIQDRQRIDRLYGTRDQRKILEVNIPEFILPVATGRNLAVMVEAAVQNQILLKSGHDASEEFIQRQRDFMDNNNA
ncbi:MAG: HPr(Ser) kinase/phosphatase [Gammaproteobacteria bacterium]|nr:HPr(Ser) kinase/phosphatase [Gammaproteobacteria bacterium]